MIPIPADIWMPIVVALVTTVLISPIVGLYIKPRIEARQQRLIRDRQQIDEVIFKFQKISLSMAALIDDNRGTKSPSTRERHNKIMLNQAYDSTYDLMDILSRLSPRYVKKHMDHIGKTLLFLGSLLAGIDSTRSSREMSVSINDVKTMAGELEKFDAYFMANISFKDSQEKWFRRIFWKIFIRKSTKQNIDSVLQNYNLQIAKKDAAA